MYNGIFIDAWRLENGKIKEQWCSATTAHSDALVAQVRTVTWRSGSARRASRERE